MTTSTYRSMPNTPDMGIIEDLHTVCTNYLNKRTLAVAEVKPKELGMYEVTLTIRGAERLLHTEC